MKAIPGIEITSAMLTTSIAEPSAGETIWVSGSYAVGDKRIVVATHRKYSCITPGVSTLSPELEPSRWEDIGATNAYAMFDKERNVKSVANTSMTVAVTPGQRFDSCAIMAADGELLELVMTVGASIVWTSGVVDLRKRKTARWYEYFFGIFSYAGNKIFFDLPPYSGATMTMTLTRSSGTVEVGSFVVGTATYLGKIITQARSEAINFSTVERDSFGGAKLNPKPQKPATTQTLVAEATTIESVRALRSLGNAAIIVWSGLDDHDYNPYFEALLVNGFYKEFAIGLPNKERFEINLTVEEL